MLRVHSDSSGSSKSSGQAAVPDPICLNNASLHALQNLQPWVDSANEDQVGNFQMDDDDDDDVGGDDDVDDDNDDKVDENCDVEAVDDDGRNSGDVTDEGDDSSSLRHSPHSRRVSINCSPPVSAAAIGCSTVDRRTLVLHQPYLTAA